MPRYTPDTLAGRSVKAVFCDGAKIDHVIEADDDLGFAVVLEWDECGGTAHSRKRLVTGEIVVTFG